MREAPVRSGESLPAQKKGMSSSHRPRPQPAQRTPGFVDDTALAVERALRSLRADPEAARRDPRIVALEKDFAIGLVGIKGNIFYLIGAPYVLR